MKPPHWQFLPFVAALIFLGGSFTVSPIQAAADCTAADLLPPTVIAVAEIPQLSDVVTTVMEHSLRERLQELPAYTTLLQSKEVQRLKTGISAFEGSMQQPWPQALQKLTSGGITLALDTQNNGGLAVLVKASDSELLERLRDFLLAVQLLGGKSAQPGEYRGFTPYNLAGDQKMVLLDNWFVLVNHSELGKAIIDQYLDRNQPALSSKATYVTAAKLRNSASRPPAVWAYVDLAAVRQAGVAKGLFAERIDNFFAEVVAGGILANIRRTPYATFAVDIQDSGVQLQITTPHNRQWEPPREYFFGEPNPAVAPPLLNVNQRLFALSTYRDLSQMWLRSSELVGDKAAEQLAQADTQLTTFFAGRDFGEDVLGGLQSGIQIVAKSQEYTDTAPTPAIKLPAVAARFRMRNAAHTQTELRRIFQSFIGFLNVTGAQNGQPQLDLGMESVGSGQLFTATYVPNANLPDRDQAPINFNFSPSLGFIDDSFILASTASLARELIELPPQPSGSLPGPEAHNTQAALDATVLREVLASNREQLIANNMLEKGNRPQAAEAEIGLLLELISLFRDAQLSLDFGDEAMRVQFSVAMQAD